VVKREAIPGIKGHRNAQIVALVAVVAVVSWTNLNWHARTTSSCQLAPTSRAAERDQNLLSSRRADHQETCSEPAAVNEALLGKWGCKLLRDSCLDQVSPGKLLAFKACLACYCAVLHTKVVVGVVITMYQGRILLHTGEKTPGHPKYTDKPLFTFDHIAAPFALPGYPEALGVGEAAERPFHCARIGQEPCSCGCCGTDLSKG
jgi:hypothetical protein